MQVYLILLIPVCLPRVFGRMVGQNRQGYAILAAMSVIAIASIALTIGFETNGSGTVPQAVGSAVEGRTSGSASRTRPPTPQSPR